MEQRKMTRKETIYDITTGETIERAYTNEENALADAQTAEMNAAIAEAEALKNAQEADKAALLAKLGITADEAKLLLQ
jgi:hypothetical protein